MYVMMQRIFCSCKHSYVLPEGIYKIENVLYLQYLQFIWQIFASKYHK